MRNESFEIVVGVTKRPHKVIGQVKARVGAVTIFSKAPTINEVNLKLQEVAIRLGANAVVNISYKRGISATSWKSLYAHGTAVVFESHEVTCISCAESIKREAKKCRFCGELQV